MSTPDFLLWSWEETDNERKESISNLLLSIVRNAGASFSCSFCHEASVALESDGLFEEQPIVRKGMQNANPAETILAVCFICYMIRSTICNALNSMVSIPINDKAIIM